MKMSQPNQPAQPSQPAQPTQSATPAPKVARRRSHSSPYLPRRSYTVHRTSQIGPHGAPKFQDWATVPQTWPPGAAQPSSSTQQLNPATQPSSSAQHFSPAAQPSSSAQQLSPAAQPSSSAQTPPPSESEPFFRSPGQEIQNFLLDPLGIRFRTFC